MQQLIEALDWIFGWSLYLPPLLAITALAFLTGVVLVLCQKYFTNQQKMRMFVTDAKTLKRLTKEAKKAGDKERFARYQALNGMIGWRRFLESFKPVPIIMVPIMLLVTWGGNRLAFLPLRPEQDVKVRAYFSEGADGLAHIIPREGLTFLDGPIQSLQAAEGEVTAAGHGQQPLPYALWRVKGKVGHYELDIRYQGKTYPGFLLDISEGCEVSPQLQLPDAPSKMAGEEEVMEEYRLERVELGLEENVPIKVWKVHLNWLWSYFVLAMTFGLGLRSLLGVK